MKGTRWAFGQKLGPGADTRYIFMPQESIKIKYRILQMVQASSYGDNFRIQIQQKPLEERLKKSVSNNSIKRCASVSKIEKKEDDG